MIQQRTIVSLNQHSAVFENHQKRLMTHLHFHAKKYVFGFLRNIWLFTQTFFAKFGHFDLFLDVLFGFFGCALVYKQKVKCSISDDGLGNEDVYFLMLLDLDEKVKHKVFFSDKLKKKGHLSFCSTSCVMSCWLWFFAYFAHLWHCKIFFKDTTKSRLLEED
mgnify:CR=1 FL=1